MTTLAAFLVDWHEALDQLAQADCLMGEGLALRREATARMLLLEAELAQAFPDVPGRTLEALLSPHYEVRIR